MVILIAIKKLFRNITKSLAILIKFQFTIKQKNVLIGMLNPIRTLSGAGGGTRTHMPLLTTDFESAPSTNSSTPALTMCLYRIPHI